MDELKPAMALRPFGLLYGLATGVRNSLFDKGLLKAWKAPLPVVSIGNITAGGTGKTPLVDWIVKFYLRIGEHPAILSRGYGRKTRGVQLVADGKQVLLEGCEGGDEATMLAWNNPGTIVVVAEKRREGAEFLLKRFNDKPPSVIILDDAFQHRQIARNLDILVINTLEPLFEGKLLPEGRLRESLRGLERADAFLLNKVEDQSRADMLANKLGLQGKPVMKARFRTGDLLPFENRGELKENQPPSGAWLAFAGIASPESFVATLEHKGVAIASKRFFGDHESYSSQKMERLAREAEAHGLGLVTTEKDWYRLRGTEALAALPATIPCRYLQVETEIFEGRETLEYLLRKALTP